MRSLRQVTIKGFALASYISAICAILAPGSSQGADAVVFYVNGIFDTPVDSDVAGRELFGAVQDLVGRDQLDNVSFAVNYNSTNGGLDILEAALQDKLTDETQLWEWISEYIPMPSWCQELVKQIDVAFYKTAHAIDDNLRSHTNEYRINIENNRNVVIVPHSQGNFFANLSYGALSFENRKKIAIVAAANPDSFVAGGGEYTTLEEDIVITAVRAARMLLGGPGPLAANFTNGPNSASRDLLHHAFVEAYMERSSGSRARIAEGVASALKRAGGP